MNRTVSARRWRVSGTIAFLAMVLPVLAFGTGANQYGTLTGVVRDNHTKEPLVGAVVRIEGTALGSTTDNQGRYVFPYVHVGTYRLRVSYFGYQTVVIRDVIVHQGLRTMVDVEMTVEPLELEAVEIRADRPLIQRDLASTTYAIGALQIERLPISTYGEVLGLQPGTTLEGNIRGSRVSETGLFIDGLPMSDPILGAGSITLPRSSMAGITIVTGGFEAEYGNAQSGIVQILTSRAASAPVFRVRVERDSWLPENSYTAHSRWMEAEVSASGPIIPDRVSGFTALQVHTEGTRWWQDFDKAGITSPLMDLSGVGKVDWNVSPTTEANVHVVAGLRRTRDYEFSWRYNLLGLPERRNSFFRASAGFTQTFGDRNLASLVVAYNHQSGRIGPEHREDVALVPYQYDFFLQYIVEGSRAWRASMTHQTITLKGDLHHQEGEHSFKAGFMADFFDIRSDVLKVEPQLTYYGKPIPGAPMLDYSSTFAYRPYRLAGYLQDRVQLASDGSIATLGVRWDMLDPTASRPTIEYLPTLPGEYQQEIKEWVPARKKMQVSPRLALTSPIGVSSYLFINFGQYYQFPAFELLYAGLSPSRLGIGFRNVRAGNPDLSPERTIAWEIGIKQGFSDRTVGTVTYFRKRMQNQIDAMTLIPFDSKSSGDYGFAAYVNNAEATAQGVELLLHHEPGAHAQGSLSYGYMVTEGISEDVDQNIRRAQWGFDVAPVVVPLSWDQRHTVKADVAFDIARVLRTNVVFLYNSPRPYTYYPTRDGRTPADTTVTFVPNNARMGHILFLNVKLSFDVTIAQGIRGTVSLDGRNVLNALNIRWMDSSGRVGGELGDPSAYYDPRRIRLSLELRLDGGSRPSGSL